MEHLLKTPLTVVPEFHSHLESLKDIGNLENQISFSYSERKGVKNVIEVGEGRFSDEEDPTRFLRLHCRLFPDTEWCSREYSNP